MKNPVDLKTQDDDALARCAARGDRSALEMLLQRNAPLAARVAFHVLGRHDEALDAAQVALMQVAKNIGTKWSGTSFRAWLMTCAHGAAVDLIRSDERHKRHQRKAMELRNEGDHSSQADSIDRQETLKCLRDEIGALPPKTALALILHHLEGLPVADVAQHVQLSKPACLQRLHRGREVLRERLQRRGVVLMGATGVAMLFESLGKESSLWVESLGAMQLNKLTHVPLSEFPVESNGMEGHVLKGIPGSEAQPGTNGTQHIESCNSKPDRGASLMKIIFSILFLGLALVGGGFLFNLIRPAKSSTATSSPVTNEAPGKVQPDASHSSLGDQKVGKRNVPISVQWQSPYFQEKNYQPCSLSAHDKEARLLVVSLSEAKAALLESHDSGAHWLPASELPEMSAGVVALGPKGREAILAIKAHKRLMGGKIQYFNWGMGGPGALGERDGYDRLEWVVRDAAGTYAEKGAIWSPMSMAPFGGKPKLFLTENAAWAFAIRATTNYKLPQVVLARGGAKTVPQPLKTPWQGKGTGEPAAWVFDDDTAGVVVFDSIKKVLMHHATADGGSTWKSNQVAFDFQYGSGDKPFQVLPVALTREGKMLALLAISVYIPAPLEGKGVSMGSGSVPLNVTGCVLISEDLGASWGPPMPVTTPTTSRQWNSDFSIHAALGKLYVGRLGYRSSHKIQNKGAFEAAVGKRNKSLTYFEFRPFVFVSSDQGGTWYDPHVFEQFQHQTAFFILGGSETSVHMSFLQNAPDANEKKSAWLIIRSLEQGYWKADENTLPSWFKPEEKLPEPTGMDF